MDGYSFDEGVAFLVLVKAPLGVIKHLQKTHNRSHLHSEIHKQLRLPRTKEILRKNAMEMKGNFPQIPSNSPIEIETKSNEIETKSDENEPKSDENEPKPDKNEPKLSDTGEAQRPASSDDEADIILTKHDVRSERATRYEEMPNELTQKLWLQRQDLYREMQENHRKMREVPQGEEHDEERAQYRAEVLRLDGEIDKIWKQIDAEIERVKAEQERADKKADNTAEKPAFDVANYRDYINKALRKKSLSEKQLTELQRRVDALLKAKVEIKKETIKKLKAIGIEIG